jgi:hypothetical protein
LQLAASVNRGLRDGKEKAATKEIIQDKRRHLIECPHIGRLS